MKHEFYYTEDKKTLVVLVERNGKTFEAYFDANNYSKLMDKRMYFRSNDLYYRENGETISVKELITGVYKGKITFIDRDNLNLRKSNLQDYGLRNRHWIEGDTLFVEVQHDHIVTFDASDYELLVQLDTRISVNQEARYPIIAQDGTTFSVKKYLRGIKEGE